MTLLNYIAYISIFCVAVLGSTWFSSQIEPVLSLVWVQQALLKWTSFLFAYIVAVWLTVFYIAIFRKKVNESEGSLSSQGYMTTGQALIGFVALVAIPLSIILWGILDAI